LDLSCERNKSSARSFIGDSLRDYYPEIDALAGKAVGRLATSRFAADPVLLTEIATVLDGTKFDLIHSTMECMDGNIARGLPQRFPQINQKRSVHAQGPLLWATPGSAAEP
jgi:hypothetical protein